MCGYFCIGFIDFMFAGETLILLACFLFMILKKNGSVTLSYFKNEVSLNLSDQTKFRLIEFNKIKTILTQKFMKEKQ